MIGYIAGALTTIAFAPSLIKALTTKSTTDISLLMLLCSTSCMVLWLFYGIQVDAPAIIAANSVSVILAASLRGLKLNYEYINLVDNFGKKIRGSKNKNAFLWK
ncbi:SemiSWEET family sugar transporter [Methanosarcina sp. 2.H.A.1B.4]|uniref:SemiSWEET family sugar transporter n=1 Tax=Methanosarcina sp. 2.H.A.1B.4 TaxID=1483600 RepID=UPI000622A782|nr:SemiSWEET family transporter [Methanosarcina sp. 2.H.A.1B.4]KKG12741.1 membrane protein [Methanosarcina sp. 2.H.A.1B.4]